MKEKKENKDLEKAIAEMNQKYPDSTIKTGIEAIKKQTIDFISLDKLSGGIPKGKWSMIWGAKGSCKTTLCHLITKKVQSLSGKVVYIDAEHTYDKEYASSLGVDTNKIIFNQPSTLEEAETLVKKFAPLVDLVVVDSVCSVASIREVDRDLEEDTMALIPRKLSQFFRITTSVIGKSKAMIILVNQTRMNLGSMIVTESYPGGHALAHYTSLIIHTRRGARKDAPTRKEGSKTIPIGFNMVMDVTKTKISATEGKKSMFNYYYDVPHFHMEEDLIINAIQDNIITSSGGWYMFGERKFHGKEEIMKAVTEDKKLLKEIKTKYNL